MSKKANPLDKIKQIEQERIARREKMEEDKKLKEEKKAYNLASGKNVDIDFEIMIEKSKFKEKILTPHVSSAEMKVRSHFIPVGSLRTQASHLQEGGAERGDRLGLLRQPPDQDSRAQVQSRRDHQIRGKSHLHLRQHIQRGIGNCKLNSDLQRYLQCFAQAPRAPPSAERHCYLFCLRADWLRKDFHHE